MTIKTKAWDVTEHLRTDEEIVAYINAVIEDSDPALLAAAIGDVARARGMTQIAQETGRSRESLYRALSDKGNPELTTLMGVLKALGLRLQVAAPTQSTPTIRMMKIHQFEVEGVVPDSVRHRSPLWPALPTVAASISILSSTREQVLA